VFFKNPILTKFVVSKSKLVLLNPAARIPQFRFFEKKQLPEQLKLNILIQKLIFIRLTSI
jgi:hypothetical protein